LFRWFYELLYGSVCVEFKSAFGLEASIEQLRAATKRSAFSALAKEAAVGTVQASRVRLQRVIPMVGNSFKPFFIGYFESRRDEVWLVGRFTIWWPVKVFMSVWFGFILLFCALSLVAPVKSADGKLPFILGPAGMFLAGIALVRLGRWFSRNDQDWLSCVISSALGKRTLPDELGRSPSGLTIESAGPPMVLRIVACVLALPCLVGLGMSFSTLDPHPLPEQLLQYVPRVTPRAFLQAISVAGIFVALGVHQRKRFAWLLVFVILALGEALNIFNLYAGPDMPGPMRPVFLLMSLVVTAVWTRWWYGQRVHFDRAAGF
jgi:hypothetical protein